MFEQFMQMGGPAAFALTAAFAGPTIVLIVAIVNRTIRRGQDADHVLKLREQADKARQIEAPKRRPEV